MIMVTVSTYFGNWQCEKDFCLALATEKIIEMATGDTPVRHWWANVTDSQTGELLYQCFWQKGMLHTWSAETNTEDEMILFL